MRTAPAQTPLQQTADPPPFIIGDQPYFDPFEADCEPTLVMQRPDRDVATSITTRLVVHTAFLGMLGLLALSQAPGWSLPVLAITWLAVARVS